MTLANTAAMYNILSVLWKEKLPISISSLNDKLKNEVLKFEACYKGFFCLQYSAFYVFVKAWNTQVCVHTVTLPGLCFCTYTLPSESRFIFRQILLNIVCKAFSRAQIKFDAWQWCDSLSTQSCILHAWTNNEKLSRSLRFVRKRIAATKLVDQIKDSDPEI